MYIKLFEEFKDDLKVEMVDDATEYTFKAYYNNQIVGSLYVNLVYDIYTEFEEDEEFTEEDIENIFEEDVVVKISWLKTEDDFRSKGVATLLMKKAMSFFEKQGYKEYYVNASPMGNMNLENLVNFYRKFGFISFYEWEGNAVMYKHILS
jgi:GNAT superfamily N-acetyltransferase